jgi:hypothetical protein
MEPTFTAPRPPVGAAPQPSIAISGLAGPGTGRGAVPLAVPLPYLLTGALGAVLFGVLLPWLLPLAALAPEAPHVLALVHVATLGWLTMTILGASLQLTPVILASPLRAARLIRWQYPLYASGVALLVTGFWLLRPWMLALGGALVVLAVAHHVVVLGATLARAERRPLTARFLAAALVYLGIVVSLGLTAALNLGLGFLGPATQRLLLAHITLGVLGWLTNMLLGVSYTLVRMFALVHGHADTLGRRVFLLLNASVPALAVAFALDWRLLLALGGVALVAAVWLFAYDYSRMLRLRRRKPLEVTQRHGIAAVCYLGIAVPVGLAAALAGWATPGLLAALGLAALVGWLGQSIVGYLYKIIPFLVWQERYGPRVGHERVPLMRDLIHERWAWASWWLLNGGLPLTLLGLIASLPPLMLVGSAAVGAGLLLAALNVLRAVAPR